MSLFQFFAEKLFPAKCLGCGETDTWWCRRCNDAVVWFAASRCPLCQRLQKTARCCRSCRHKSALMGAVSAGRYSGGLRHAIVSLKFRSSYAGWNSFSAECVTAIQRIPYSPDLMLVPVPLSKQRLRTRGHNQSVVFAMMLSEWTDLRISTSLRRIRSTTPQASLDRRHRRRNVGGAFLWTGNAPRRALLVDDVATTYSTLSECAATLHAAGCREVWAITLARA